MAEAAVIGVAGNVAGHLEQAGEASDFVGVVAAAGAPKGVFPVYLKGSPSFLGTDPLSGERLVMPDSAVKVQLEPEVGLRCAVTWDGDRVVAVTPAAFAAYDDTSLRREGAKKISHKKNWGPATKGLGPWRPFRGWADLDRHRIACFLIRDGACHAYGVDTPAGNYGYKHDQLLDWLVGRLNGQRDGGPLEDVGALLRSAGRPDTLVVSLGATTYTPFGQSTGVRAGDVAVTVVYDGGVHAPEAVAGAVAAGAALPDASVLRRDVVAG